jgi:hypothetical protein
MRATSMMRFVVLGAAGFGIGWAFAGLFNVVLVGITSPMFQPGSEPPPGWATWPPYFAYFFAGACGGAGLGLAIGSWKRTAALALAGSLGLGLGIFPLFILGFIGLLPSWTSIAMGLGVVGGAALGLVFGGLMRIVILAAAGLVGFGIGGAIATTLRMPFALYPFEVDFVELWQAPLILLQHLLVQAMVGLIGGASLGAALGYLERRRPVAERRPRVR